MEEVEGDLFGRARELEGLNAELRATTDRERRTARSLAGLATTVSALADAETTRAMLERLFAQGRTALGADVAAVTLIRPGSAPHALTESRDERLLTADLDPGSPLPMAVAAGGRAVVVRDAGTAGDAEIRRLAEGLGLAAWAALPLRAGGRLLGSWTIGWRDPQPLDGEDLRVLEAWAAQCAQAVDRVSRLEAERRRAHATRSLAEALQRSLLTDPPQPDDLGISVRYRPAAQEARVGGDWYDAFLSRDGATTLVVGDVAGHDRASAAVMGQVRNMLRGIAHALDASPATVLSALDRAMADLGIGTLVTAVVGRVELPASGAAGVRTLRWSSAGHPAPLLLHADGSAELLDRRPERLLGTDPATARSDATVPLVPGDTVVLYTDGLVERRGTTLDEGTARLLDAGRDLAAHPLEGLCDALLARLAPAAVDDVALLALRVER
ncbi:PP2C family protein-serine/threonine phosphatase [Geodermatophilus sp. SYSU D00758]